MLPAMRLACALLSMVACAASSDPIPDPPGPDAPIDGTPVASFVTTTCSTASVLALSRQVADEVDCMLPGQLVRFEAGPTIVFSGGAVLPYLSADARDDLYAAAAAGGGAVMRVTSAFRTVVQQYLLRKWFELGRCDIAAAMEPGQSNHESGRALDIANYAEWVTILAAHRWDHSIPDDPVHFDHLPSPDILGADVLAFQRLWNRNAPGDLIDENGSYDPATVARVARAPAEGFATGAICTSALRRADQRSSR
jgi:hypothetical protein